MSLLINNISMFPEFDGKWKMLHYFAVDFFSPVLASPSVDVTNQLKVDVISDHKLHSHDLSLQLNVYNWHSFDPVFSQRYQFSMVGNHVKNETLLCVLAWTY